MRRRFLLVGVASAAVLATAVAGCGSSNNSAAQETISVSAAASLTDAFQQLAQTFEAANPGTNIDLTFGASSTAVQQVIGGAPIDVLATASTSTMADAVNANVIKATPQVFASNSLAIAIPPSNPGNVSNVADLSHPTTKVAICQPEVPCGKAALELFSNAGLNVKPVTREPDVRAVLAKVEQNEVDAGVVYRSDVVSAGGGVKQVPIPVTDNVDTSYSIAELQRTTESELATKFIAFVLSPQGQQVLRQLGFAPPPG